MQNGIIKLINKIDIRFYNPNGIQDIIWCRDFEELQIENNVNPTNIFIQGTREYIDEVNTYLDANFQKIYREIRIIDCYELYDSNDFLYEILDKHDYVFNTGGLKKKEYVFPDYKEARVSKIY